MQNIQYQAATIFYLLYPPPDQNQSFRTTVHCYIWWPFSMVHLVLNANFLHKVDSSNFDNLTPRQNGFKQKVRSREKNCPNLIVGTLRVLKKIVWKSFTVDFFYLDPPGFEPGTSCTLAERTTDVATKTERFWAKNVLLINCLQ